MDCFLPESGAPFSYFTAESGQTEGEEKRVIPPFPLPVPVLSASAGVFVGIEKKENEQSRDQRKETFSKWDC